MALTPAQIDLRIPAPSLVAAGFGKDTEPLDRRFRAIAVGLVVSDGVCAAVAFLVAHMTLFGTDLPIRGLILELVVSVACWTGSFYSFGLYQVRYLSAIEEFRRLVGATAVATTVVILIRVSVNAAPHRRWLGLTWLFALALELVARRLWRARIGSLQRSGRLAARTLIVGTNDEAMRLAETIGGRGSGVTVVGQADPGEELAGLISSLAVDSLFVASSAVTSEQMARVARAAAHAGIELRTSANVTDVLVSRLSVQSVDGVLALSLKPARMSHLQAAAKRAFDVILASVALVLLAPVLAASALAVKFSSPGPVLFRQARVTRGGREFEMLKFRTMVVDARAVAASDEIDLTVPFFKMADDPRVTPVGRVLRKFSLDELPQLWQVVTGDLSLVGPRPLPADQVAANPELAARHEVRAGITGWWQVNGRSSVAPEEALRMDLFYLRNWSLSLDFFILLKTVGAVLSNKGAC